VGAEAAGVPKPATTTIAIETADRKVGFIISSQWDRDRGFSMIAPLDSQDVHCSSASDGVRQ
jgi:hypothetical protein